MAHYPDHYSVSIGDGVVDPEGFVGIVTRVQGDGQAVFVKLATGGAFKYPYHVLDKIEDDGYPGLDRIADEG